MCSVLLCFNLSFSVCVINGFIIISVFFLVFCFIAFYECFRHANKILFNGRLLGRLVAADLPGKIGKVRMVRTTKAKEIYLVSLLPPSASKSPIDK